MSCVISLVYAFLAIAIPGQIVSAGSTLSSIFDGIHMRELRSPHLLHRRMCPVGANRESCFYSQLSMFMKLHDSLTDPVSMRNIGKRSTAFDDAQNVDTALFSPVPYADALENSANDYSPNEEYRDGPLLDNEQLSDFNSQLENRPMAFSDMKNRLGRILGQSNGFSSEANVVSPLSLDALKTKRNFNQSTDNTQYIKSPNKRQIICPPGMPKMKCYDHALAFYMRLLRTMGDQ